MLLSMAFAGLMTLVVCGAITLYFGKELRHFEQHPPLDLAVLERFMKPPAEDSPERTKILKLQKDYGQMVKFRRGTLWGGMVSGTLVSATGAFLLCSLRTQKGRQKFLENRKTNARERAHAVPRDDKQSKGTRLCFFAASAITMWICIDLMIHFRTELMRVHDYSPYDRATLEFYMLPTVPGSPDEITAHRLAEDYERMGTLYEPLLRGTVIACLIPILACVLIMLWQLMWLWPRKAQPQPQIERTPAA